MDWTEALEIVMTRTKHEAYRSKCDSTHPDHEQWRTEVIRMATGGPREFPSLMTQAGNVIAAAGRVIAAAAHGKQVRVSPEERDRRWGLCMTCVNLVDDRCKLCGCHFRAKIELATERCPIGKWERVES